MYIGSTHEKSPFVYTSVFWVLRNFNDLYFKSWSLLINVSSFVPVKVRAQCYDSLHSNTQVHVHVFRIIYHITMQLAGGLYNEAFLKNQIHVIYQYITNTCACVESPIYLVWIIVCFLNIIKTLLHGLRSLYNVSSAL